MKSAEELTHENSLLRERISQLSAASLRISASLDINTVLLEVVRSARSLTRSRLGVIVTTDESGQIQDFVTSGFAPEDRHRMSDWPEGPRLFAHLRDLPGPVRLPDLPSYLRSLGFSTHSYMSKTFQGTPLRYRGEHVGNFFLGAKEGGLEFTSEDEEILLMFAAQAATAIANARKHREEQRARADLEALIETSPVAVLVFDARSGTVVSLNQEAKRIAGHLGMSGRTPDQITDAITLRRADGQEISVAELPLTQALSNGETIRAEEIVIRVPNGRSITTLLNLTSIRSEDGDVVSTVVTLQDLAPLEEIERLRVEFLGLVSHELRAPLTSIKGSTATLLGASATLDPAEMFQFFRIIDEQADHMRGLISDLLVAGRIETGTLSVTLESVGVATLVDQARNTFLSGGGRHTIQIDLPPDLPRVMADRQRIVQVLNNLLSNASRNSPKSSPIRISAVRDDLYVAISVSDKGQGVSPELLPHLFRKHPRIAGSGRGGMSGSGLGLVICRGLVEAHGGRIRAESGGQGQGARFTFTIPVAEMAEAGASAGVDRSASRPSREVGGRTPILVVDDDPHTLHHVRDALTTAGYTPLLTGDPQEISDLIRTNKPRLVLLDLMLPGTDGIELMERVTELADLPVIFISGYGRDETIARALEVGAADYIVKPFSPTELVARVQAALRRTDEPPKPFRLGDLAIYYAERHVTVGGRPVQLTATEYDLLRVLSVNAGRVTTYDFLLRQVWGQLNSGDYRPVRAFIKKLRQKLGDDAVNPTYIFTERQVGYRMGQPSDV